MNQTRLVVWIWPVLTGAGGGSPEPPTPTPAQEAATRTQTQVMQEQLRIAQGQEAMANAIVPLQMAQQGYTLRPATSGETLGTGQYEIPIGGKNYVVQLTPDQQQINDINKQVSIASGQQALNAIQGKMPIDPAVEEDISRQSQQLQADLANRLGPGWQTSDPGIRAMNEFQRQADLTRFNIRYGMLSNQNAISLGTQQGLNAQQAKLANSVMAAQQPYLLTANMLGQGAGTAANIYNQQQGAQELGLHRAQIGANMTSSAISGVLGAAGLGVGAALAM